MSPYFQTYKNRFTNFAKYQLMMEKSSMLKFTIELANLIVKDTK